MTCRHKPGDSSCSSHPNYVDPYKYSSTPKTPVTPDAENYIVENVEAIGNSLVLQVKYPNCASCAFEGKKTMVFLNTTLKSALMWEEIDPHFRDPKKKSSMRQAPSPAARFPGSDEGWSDALEYARRKVGIPNG